MSSRWPDRCQLCGGFGETRPYGPNGEDRCFTCGMRDETSRAFAAEMASVVGAIQLCLAARGVVKDREVVNVIERMVADVPVPPVARAPVRLLTGALKAIREAHEAPLAGEDGGR